MEFNDYQNRTNDTAIFPVESAHTYLTLGLVGEAGEIANKVKKSIRDDNGFISTEKRTEIREELGDCLWYIAQLAEYLGLSLDNIARINLNKLRSRKNRGVLGGSGDNR